VSYSRRAVFFSMNAARRTLQLEAINVHEGGVVSLVVDRCGYQRG